MSEKIQVLVLLQPVILAKTDHNRTTLFYVQKKKKKATSLWSSQTEEGVQWAKLLTQIGILFYYLVCSALHPSTPTPQKKGGCWGEAEVQVEF